MDDISELWLPIPGYEGFYEVSNRYRIRSLGRVSPHGKGEFTRTIATKILKTSRNNGKLVAYICPPERKGKGRAFYIEAAVANLFPHQRPDLVEVNGEEWRDIPGFSGYQVSSHGRVRSIDRFVNRTNHVSAKRWTRGRILSQGLTGVGYLKVELSANGRIKTMAVHRLVAMAFISNPDNLPIVHHKDEVKTNNKIENLEWATAQTNIGSWFDKRRTAVSPEILALMVSAINGGREPTEVLDSFTRRRMISVGTDTIEAITEASKLGMTPEQILASLPSDGRRKP